MPKYAVVFLIIVISTGLFGLWWFFGGSDKVAAAKAPPSINTDGKEGSEEEKIPLPIEIDTSTMFVAGKTLYALNEEGIEAVRWNWISDVIPDDMELNYREKEDLIIASRRDDHLVIQPDGLSPGVLRLQDGGKFDGYLMSMTDEAVFVRDGDLWKAGVDWNTARTFDERQITNLGYIRGRPLVGRLVALGSNALFYKDLRNGLVRIDLKTGNAESQRLTASYLTSPDGRFMAIGGTENGVTYLQIYDIEFDALERHAFPRRMNAKLRQFWLHPDRLVIAAYNDLFLFEKEIGTADGPPPEEGIMRKIYSSESTRNVDPIPPASPGGRFVLLNDPAKGLVVLDVENPGKNPTPDDMPKITITGANWISDSALLIASDVSDSEVRGTWFVEVETGMVKSVFAQPYRSKFASGRRANFPVASFPHQKKALFHALNEWNLIDLRTGEVTVPSVPIDGKVA
ncbi:MAG: hypothetical protein AAGA58_19185, partial [Verrucomicrobiota bacterium]